MVKVNDTLVADATVFSSLTPVDKKVIIMKHGDTSQQNQC